MQTYTYKGYSLEYAYDEQEDAFYAHVKIDEEHHTLTAKSTNRLQKLFEEKVDISLTEHPML